MHQRGLRPSHSVARRSRVLIGNAQYLPAREAIITADDYVYQRGVKRSFGDDDDTGDHSYPLEFPGTAANGRKGTPEQLENNRRLAQRGSDGGLVQHVGSTAECHRGYSVRRAGDSDEVAHGASDDGAVQAELRAEILNGVRHLLHNESEIDCLVQLCSLLKEKNTALLERAIHRRGVAECVGLLEETLVSDFTNWCVVLALCKIEGTRSWSYTPDFCRRRDLFAHVYRIRFRCELCSPEN